MKTTKYNKRIKGLMNLKNLGCVALLIFSFSQSLIFLSSCTEEPDGSNLNRRSEERRGERV